MGDQKLNIKLVGEVEKHPVLYNFRLPGYSKKNETEKAWNEVAKAVNMTGVKYFIFPLCMKNKFLKYC